MAALTPADIATLQAAQALIERLLAEAATPEPVSPATTTVKRAIAWGAKVSETFRERVWWIADTLSFNPDWLMACMAWETGRKFTANVKNMAGSGAVGLIQFMPSTATALGTTTAALSAMTAEDQLRFVYRYLLPWAGKISNLSDLYFTILWPKGVGQPEDYIVFDGRNGSTAFRQNAGFDTNKDKVVTKAEASVKLYAILTEGLRVENVG